MKRRIIELRSFQLTGMLMAMFWLSTFYAFAQSQDNEPRVKKKIVITQIDENGNIQTETEEIEIPDVDKLLNDDHLFNLGAPGFNKGIKKVVVLDANEEIPQEIRKEITNMGLNVTNVKNQLKSAEQGIIIKKSIGQPATIEDYTDLISPGIGMYTFPKHDLMDIDIDIENHGNGIIHLNRDGQQETFKFDGKNIPEDIQKKLDELGIDLQHLDHGNNSWMDKNNGKLDLNGQNFEFHSDDGKQKRRMMIITDENEMSDEIKGLLEEQDINLEELKSKARSYSQSHRNKFECNEKAEMPVLGVMVSDNEKKVTIDKVVENSAASEAGLKAGDIITEINGTSMESKYEVVRLIKAKKPGNELTIKYLRNGKNKKTKAILKAKKINKPNWNSRQFESLGKAGCDDVRKFPLNENRSNGVPPQWNRQFEFGGHGLGRSRWNMSQDCETLCNTPMLGVMIQNNRSNAGAEVTKVFPNTGADQAGLLKDDIITSIDGKTVEGMTSLISIIKEYKPGENVTIEFTRQGNAQKVKTMITSKVESKQTTPCDCTRSDFRKEIDKEIIILKKGKTSLFLDEPAPTAPSALQPRIRLGRKNTLNVTAVALYPNPNDGEFTIDFALENSEPVTITVLDLAGREVYKNQLNEFNGNHRQVIDITEQAPGSYFLHIQQGKEGYTKKFIYNR